MPSPNPHSATAAETPTTPPPAAKRPSSSELSSTSTSSSPERQSEESEYGGGRRTRRRKTKKAAATSSAAKVVKRRRAAGPVTIMPRGRQVAVGKRAMMTRSPEGSSSSSGSEERVEGGRCEGLDGATASPASPLKWRDIPYPGLPVRWWGSLLSPSFRALMDSLMLTRLSWQQPGYAFSYASGPICFLKVQTSASKCLSVHWHRPQNYVAYIIYSLHRLPHVDNKLEGLNMVNELAARGFIGDEDCLLQEEMVDGTRALSFRKGGIGVSVAKLGDVTAFRGYTSESRVDDEDRKMILEKLQVVMHDRALPRQTPTLSASPGSSRCSDESKLRGTTLTTSEEDKEAFSTPSGEKMSLEDSGLVKTVKIHWRQSKWIADNIHSIRSPPTSSVRTTADSDTSQEGEDSFKAVVVWSNKSERKEGFNLLERMIAARLGGKGGDYKKDVMVCEETLEGGELWLVYHKKDVVVAFPGRHGDEDFLGSVRAMEQVWS